MGLVARKSVQPRIMISTEASFKIYFFGMSDLTYGMWAQLEVLGFKLFRV